MKLDVNSSLSTTSKDIQNLSSHSQTYNMFNNSTISPAYDAIRLCYVGGVVRNESFTLYAINLSASVFIAILSPMAVVGNFLIMAAIWRNQALRTPSYILLSGLAFTDLCTGLITQPFYVASVFICLELSQDLNNNQLSFLPYVVGIAAGSSNYFTYFTLLLLTLMSVERWLHMTRRSLLTVRRSCFVVAMISVLLIPMIVVRLLNILNNIDNLVSRAVSFIILLFCTIATPTAYFKVFKIIRRHQQQVAANDSSINLAKYKKSVFTILYILTLLFVSVIPLLIFAGLSVFKYNPSDLQLVFVIAIMFSFLSSSLNPLIYLWRMNDIRDGVKQLLNQLFCKDS